MKSSRMACWISGFVMTSNRTTWIPSLKIVEAAAFGLGAGFSSTKQVIWSWSTYPLVMLMSTLRKRVMYVVS